MLKTPLTQAEQSFVEAMARGAVYGPDYYREWLERHVTATPAQPRPGGGAAPAPATAQDLPADVDRPIIRAHVIRALIEDAAESGGGRDAALPKGVQMTKARVTGPLDLEAIRFDRPLSFIDVGFDHGLVLRDAHLRAVTLDRSFIPFIDAANAHIRGHFRARRLPQTDFITLLSAEVDGHLVLQGSHLNPREKPLAENGGAALQCNAAQFGASVFLRQGFSATGCVSFVRARIAGQLACVGGRFSNPDGLALYCNATEIGVDVFLDDGFEAVGEVNFTGARIGGQLSCFGGRFENPGSVALDCNGAEIGADVFLREGFLARGKVDFARARIGGSFQLRTDSRIEGTVDLRQARAAVLMDEPECWPAPPNSIDLDGFVYDRFGDETPLDLKARAAWLNRSRQENGRVLFRPQPWTQAAAVLEAMGHDHEARTLLQKRESRRPVAVTGPFGPLARLWKLFFAATTGYGYRPGLTLFWAVVTILVGTVIFERADDAGRMVPRDPGTRASLAAADPVAEDAGPYPLANYESFKALLYSVDLFLPVIDLGQAAFWMPNDPASTTPPLQGPPESDDGADTADDAGDAREENSTDAGTSDLDATDLDAVGAQASGWLPKAWFWVQITLGWLLTILGIGSVFGLFRRG